MNANLRRVAHSADHTRRIVVGFSAAEDGKRKRSISAVNTDEQAVSVLARIQHETQQSTPPKRPTDRNTGDNSARNSMFPRPGQTHWSARACRGNFLSLRRSHMSASPPAHYSNAFLTLDKAAEYLGIPPNTLYVWRHRRQGPPSFRMGRRVMYRITALEDWVREQEEADSRTNSKLDPLNRPHAHKHTAAKTRHWR